MKSTAELVWVYCDKKTLEPVKTMTGGKIHVHSIRPTTAMIRSAEFQHRKQIALKRGFIVFVDEESPESRPEQPPIDNRFVAEGCEQFSTSP